MRLYLDITGSGLELYGLIDAAGPKAKGVATMKIARQKMDDCSRKRESAIAA